MRNATTYKQMKSAVAELDEARAELAKVANLRIGVISGGPSIADETAEFERCYRVLRGLIRQVTSEGGRRSKILAILGDSYESRFAQELLDERKLQAAEATSRSCFGNASDRLNAFERVMNSKR